MTNSRHLPLISLLLACLLALFPSVAVADSADPEQSEPSQQSSCIQPLDSKSVESAAEWLVQYTGGDWAATASPSEKADAILALVATNRGDERADELTAQLMTDSAEITDPASIAKVMIAISASTSEEDEEAATIIDTFARTILATVNETGLFEVDYASAYTQSMAILALARADMSVPSPMVDALYTFRSDDGSFGYSDGTAIVSDPDSTVLALMATRLLEVEPDANTTQTLELVSTSVTVDGYWDNFSPINTTGLTISALNDWGISLPENSVDWLVAQQLASGSWPASVGSSDENFLATTQAMFGVTGASYATVGMKFCASDPVLPPINEGGSPWPLAILIGWSVLVLVIGVWCIRRVVKN